MTVVTRAWVMGLVGCVGLMGVCGPWTGLGWARAQGDGAQPASEAGVMTAAQAVGHIRRTWAERTSARGGASEEQRVVETGSSLVQVTLVVPGRGVARGWAAGQQAGLAEVADRAAAMALEGVDSLVPQARDALQATGRERELEAARASARIAVEVGGVLREVRASTFAEAAGVLRPGLEGWVVEASAEGGAGVRREVMFPSHMMAQADRPGLALVGLVARATGDPAAGIAGVAGRELGDLARERGVRVFRFGVAHAAELSPGSGPVELTRGSRVVAMRELDGPGLRAWRDRLVEHLATRVRSADGGGACARLDGVVWAARGRAEGCASRVDVALACDALAGVHTARAKEVHGQLWRALFACPDGPMAASSDSEGQPCGDPGEEDGHGAALRAATLTLAWLGGAAPGEEASAAWRAFEEGRGGWTRAAAAPVERAFSVASGWDASIPVAARGVVALALVELARREGAESGAADWRESERGRRAVEAVRTTFADSTPGELVTHMPWLARAEARIVQAGGDDAGGTLDAPGLDASGVMRQMRSLLWERQVGAERAALDGADLEGAILLSGRGGMLQAPSWQTARPLTAAALMLGDARMTSGSERNAELLRVLASLRFLRQLTVDEAGAWDAVDAPRVLWGVRNGPWDQRLSVEASVGTLMALDATIDAVEGMK